MGYWLKMIGSGNAPYPTLYDKPWVDFSRSRWPRQVHPGDHLVLYASGGLKRVFAIAEVTSEVYEQDEYQLWPYRVDVRYLINLHPSVGVHIDEVSTASRDLLRSLRRRSYLKLTPEEYKRAATKLERAMKAPDDHGTLD